MRTAVDNNFESKPMHTDADYIKVMNKEKFVKNQIQLKPGLRPKLMLMLRLPTLPKIIENFNRVGAVVLLAVFTPEWVDKL